MIINRYRTVRKFAISTPYNQSTVWVSACCLTPDDQATVWVSVCCLAPDDQSTVWASVCCLTPDEQLLNYITTTSYISMR